MIHTINECVRCPLSRYDKPLLDDRMMADVMWLGLSAKPRTVGCAKPLDSRTISGSILAQIEAEMPDYNFYSSNLVKCAPVSSVYPYTLRYPSQAEISQCLANLEIEINELRPKVIVLLGVITAKAVFSAMKWSFPKMSGFVRHTVRHQQIAWVTLEHPSYIHVYKREQTREYVDFVKNHLLTILTAHV